MMILVIDIHTKPFEVRVTVDLLGHGRLRIEILLFLLIMSARVLLYKHFS